MQLVAYSNILTMIIFGFIWLAASIFLQKKKQKSFDYLLFFTLFYVYLFKVLDYTLFQFQSLLLLKLFVPNLMLNGQMTGEELNLVPLILLNINDMQTSFLNILLLVPFGFGLPFITNFRLKNVFFAGLLFSLIIEILQFVTGYLAGITFRVADVNDVLFNTIGAVTGYGLFSIFMQYWCRMPFNGNVAKNSIVLYISARPQEKARAEGK